MKHTQHPALLAALLRSLSSAFFRFVIVTIVHHSRFPARRSRRRIRILPTRSNQTTCVHTEFKYKHNKTHWHNTHHTHTHLRDRCSPISTRRRHCDPYIRACVRWFAGERSRDHKTHAEMFDQIIALLSRKLASVSGGVCEWACVHQVCVCVQ